MLITLSPSKGQDFEVALPSSMHSQPRQLDDSQILINELLKYDVPDIREMMTVSENIAILNVERFHTFERPFTQDNAKPALFAFKGDVYSGIQKDQYSESDLSYAQDHLRILSGLYGALRPMDLIQPYRLEMKTKLENPRGTNLYQFWDERITDSLNDDLDNQQEATLINLASNEYFKSVKPKKLAGRLLHIAFKETKAGKTRVIAIFAKRARGMMTDFILRNRIENSENLKEFNEGGYEYSPADSNDKQWVFTRPQPAGKK
ncbi:MAG TPA: peroxide stress protein YaaA [Leucothrix mucor]|nr:peroxide stress protein YaaA [Leucothrix mucor]